MKRPGGSKSTAQILTGTMRSGVHLALTISAALGLFRFQTTDRLWGLICEHYRRHFKTFTWWERWRVTSKQTLSEVLWYGKPRNHQPSTQHSSVSCSHAIKTAGRRVTDVWIHMQPPLRSTRSSLAVHPLLSSCSLVTRSHIKASGPRNTPILLPEHVLFPLHLPVMQTSEFASFREEGRGAEEQLSGRGFAWQFHFLPWRIKISFSSHQLDQAYHKRPPSNMSFMITS